MLTLFTVPKAFKGNIGIIQRNAIKSWTLLEPRPEIVLCGNEEGVRMLAKEFNLGLVPEIKRNEFGTPLVNDIFYKVSMMTKNDTLAYVNSDIVLMDDFMKTVKQISRLRRRFLTIGRRQDVDIRKPLNFEQGWDYSLREYAKINGRIYPDQGADYFVFRRGMFQDMPPFAIGRFFWDCWLLYKARSANIPLIDASKMITAIHQRHGYSFDFTPENWDATPETRANLNMLGGYKRRFVFEDATHVITPSGLKIAFSRQHLRRHLMTAPILFPASRPITWMIWKLIAAKRRCVA